jgi:hypothetical protein
MHNTPMRFTLCPLPTKYTSEKYSDFEIVSGGIISLPNPLI